MKTLQNNNVVGKMVLSKVGRDNGEAYIVISETDSNYLLLANGSTKTIQMPKKKKLKHLVITDITMYDLKQYIASNDKNINLKIKRFLKLRGICKEV